ncbi:MAG: PQQ-dependent sugar dehydrogenase, partial [Syntrophomonadaceae bacterium]
MKKLGIGLLSILLAVVLGCSGRETANPPSIPVQSEPAGQPQSPPGPLSPPILKLVEAYPNLSFRQPVEFVQAADGSDRVLVVEKNGRILIFNNHAQAQSADIFLDITGRVDSRSSEKGLLGLAFHPRFAENGQFYVNYTNRTETVVARYRVDLREPGRGLADSEQIILTIPQPYANHNGGHLAFGPDGYLYIAVGDGGSAGDPQGNGQNRSKLLGKLLRVDIDKPEGNLAYGIPADNPFNGRQDGSRPEIFAYGFRNPWKFSFDRFNGRLWLADVGQDSVEEIDIVEKGLNYGWNIMEGSQCYPASRKCNAEGLQLPVWEYRHPLG